MPERPQAPRPPAISFRGATRQARAVAAIAGRPAWGAGLRAAVATFVPLLAARVLELPGDAGTWMSLAGFSGALVDRGGAPYRTRATTLLLFAALTAAAAVLGGVAREPLPVAVLATLLVALACTLGRAWGNAGGIMGGSVLNAFVIALAIPPGAPGAQGALGRIIWVAAGAAWVAVLALGLWPLRPYRPARMAVAACYRAFAGFAREVRDAIAPGAPDGAHPPAGSAAMRAALEQAAATLAVIRRARSGESLRGQRLIVLRESCDQVFGLVIALGEVIEAIPRPARDAGAQAILADALDASIATALALADGVEDEAPRAEVVVPAAAERLRAHLDAHAATIDGWARAQYAHAALLLARMEEFTGVAARVLALMGSPHPPQGPAPAIVEEVGTDDGGPLAPLAAVLDHDSLVLRHAMRVAIVTAIAVWLTGLLDIPHGYWVTITAVVILQPYTGATTVKALQRLLGTILGGVVTAMLGAALHDPRWILLLSFVFAGLCVATLPVNYAIFSMFLTPTFVLLAEVGTGDWHLAEVRVLNTLLGGTLALLGTRLLWPRPEWSRFPAHAAALLRADADFLRVAIAEFADRSEAATARLRASRRHAGLAAINAEESFQRLLGEHRGGMESLAPSLTFLTYARRFAASTSALATSRHAVDPDTAGALAAFGAHTVRALEGMAARLEAPASPDDGGTMPAAPGHATTDDAGGMADAWGTSDPVVHARIERLDRQLGRLLDAARGIAVR